MGGLELIQGVKERNDGYLEIQKKELIPLLIKSVQDLSKEIENLKEENKILKKLCQEKVKT